ncbi:MAG: hypothetical protein R3F11_32470 [Verrucomicrobiales bacterium]
MDPEGPVRDRVDGRPPLRLLLAFTAPVDAAAAGDPASYQMDAYTYIYQSSYGKRWWTRRSRRSRGRRSPRTVCASI